MNNSKLHAVPDPQPESEMTSRPAPEVRATAVSGRRTMYVTVTLGELPTTGLDRVYVTVHTPRGQYRSVWLDAAQFQPLYFGDDQ